jgi:hypothetical protein
VVAWRDFRSTGSDLYAQHIDGAGTRRWSAAGVAVCNAPGDQHVPVLVAGEPGGVIFGWHDFRRRADADIYAQAVDASGVPRWAAGGVPICVDPGDQLSPTAVTDGKGGAIVAWDDARNGSDANIYAARIGGDGELVPTLLTLVEARAEPGRVRLRWYSPAGADVAASVQRRSPSGDWVVRGEALSDGTGFLVYEDLGVASGARYAYRLEYFLGGPPRFTEEVWIEVPSAPSLSLEGARPNPAGRRFSVSFSLPDDERATLDLLDLAGRRVLTRDLGRPGAGNHLVVLDGSEGISPGLYLVRLTQRGRSVIAKAVVRR